VSHVQKQSRVEVVVAAAPAQVWAVVADVRRVGEWSHECRAAEWLGDAGTAVPGARFRGRNRTGIWRWSRTCEIVTADAPHELVWRTVPTWLIPDSTEWRIRLDAVGGGTRITQSFQVVRAPAFHDRLFSTMLPSHRDRDAGLADDLRRLGEVARTAVPA
jgi:hypothetical protein